MELEHVSVLGLSFSYDFELDFRAVCPSVVGIRTELKRNAAICVYLEGVETCIENDRGV